MTQAELADRASLTKGFISQLENDQTSIQIDTLADLLAALGVTLTEFFSDTVSKVVFSAKDRVSVDGKGASGFELLVPSSTNYLMDPIMLTLLPGETTEEREPHPGEQFGYILKGTVTLRLGEKKYNVGKGNCFYFEADCTHQLINESAGPVQILWVIAPPQM